MFEIELFYMYKNGFGINNLQWLMCHKTKPNQTKPIKFKYGGFDISSFILKEKYGFWLAT